MKKYENYKPSGVEFIGDIPEHWEVRKLKYIMNIIRTGTTPDTKNEEYFNGDINWFKPENLNESILNFATERVTQFALESNKVKMLQEDSILVVGIGATSGKTAYLNIEATFNQQITGFHSFENCNKYYYYIFENFKLTFLQLASYTTLAILNNEFFKSFIVLLPPLDEQEKIANFLDTKNQQIEEFIKDKQNQITLLKEQKEAIINQAVTKGLDENVELKNSGIEWIGDIPEYWDMLKVTHLFNKIGSGTTPLTSNSDYYDDGTIYWVNSGDLNNGFVERSSKLITQKAINEVSSLKMYKQGALIIAMYGATIGKLGILDVNASVNQACCVLDDSSKMINKFAFFWFLVNKQNIINLGIGGGQPNISQDIIKSLRIQTPPKNEQIKLIKYIETELSKINKVIKQIQKEIDLIKEYKISLISEVVTGQIDVR